MDFDDHHHNHHHHQEEEEEDAEEEQQDASAAKMLGGGGAAIDAPPVSAAARRPRYRECLKNHAVGLGAHAVDGCGEFLPAGPEGSLDALKCAACNCHRNFHRKEVAETAAAASSAIVSFSPHHHHQGHHQFFPHHHQQHHQQQFSPYYRTPSGYLQVTPTSQRPLALPSTSGGGGGGSHSRGEEMEDMSNPSSFGGGISGSSKKRYRTKFTPDQKDKMLGFAESVGWRIQRQDDEAVDKFCNDTGIKRQVLKVWMHNNKHTLGKKP